MAYPNHAGYIVKRPREIQNHPSVGTVLRGVGQKGIDLTPGCEGRVIEWTQDGTHALFLW